MKFSIGDAVERGVERLRAFVRDATVALRYLRLQCRNLVLGFTDPF